MKLKNLLIYPIILLIFISVFSVPEVRPVTGDESLVLSDIEVDGQIHHYYTYIPSSTPIGAILALPPGGRDHTYYLQEALLDSNKDMLNSPIINCARENSFAIIFSEGAYSDYYNPNSGEKRVLAAFSEVNNSLIQLPSSQWFIYGFSAGGAGTLTISIRFPELFTGLYVAAGVFDTTTNERYELHWANETLQAEASPHLHIENLRDKTIYLAHGTEDMGINVAGTDNFSQLLDTNNIRHIYRREEWGHDHRLLLDTMNETFDMFTSQIEGTLDDFFNGYISPLVTHQPSSFNGIMGLLSIGILWTILRKRRKKEKFLYLINNVN